VAGLRFEGCAIVSADGMLARVSGDHPVELTVEADQRFFAEKLDAADVLVHGRNSHENQANSPNRKRIIATRRIQSIEAHPTSANVLFWNPAGAPVEDAAAGLGVRAGLVAVIGGTEIFDLFLDRYDVFWLTRAQRVRLPGGLPVFTGVPQTSVEDVLRRHGLSAADSRVLDAARDVVLVKWVRG
jgi:dihydrofolate reductase